MSHFSTLCKSHENIMHSQILRCWVPNSAMLSLQRTKFSYQEILLLIFFFSLHSKFTLPYAKYLAADGWTRYFRLFNQLSKPTEFQSYTSKIKKKP